MFVKYSLNVVRTVLEWAENLFLYLVVVYTMCVNHSHCRLSLEITVFHMHRQFACVKGYYLRVTCSIVCTHSPLIDVAEKVA